MFPPINVNLDQYIFPRQLVTQLAQSSSNCCRPERGELFRAELDLPLFPVRAATHLESQGRGFALLAETHMSAPGFRSQITLRNKTTSRLLQLLRQPFQQKLAFDLAAAGLSPVHLHKIKMLNAIGFAVEIFAQ